MDKLQQLRGFFVGKKFDSPGNKFIYFKVINVLECYYHPAFGVCDRKYLIVLRPVSRRKKLPLIRRMFVNQFVPTRINELARHYFNINPRVIIYNRAEKLDFFYRNSMRL